jgi:NADH-quinone oxidoreductase subunit A
MILDDYEVSNVIQIQINSWLIMIENYLPILIVFILAAGFVFVSLILSHFVGPRIDNKVKMMPYESGVDPVGETRIRFSIRFFLIALLFIIFDIEIVFLYPWAVVFKDFLTMGSFIFFEMVVFLFILAFGFVYVWKNGALEWE